MSHCLYCQQQAPAGATACHHCGMPLPTQAERARRRRLWRFQWFCVGLTLFCALMVYWLPRTIE